MHSYSFIEAYVLVSTVDVTNRPDVIRKEFFILKDRWLVRYPFHHHYMV